MIASWLALPVGVALGYGVASSRGQHWGVRVACALAWLVLVVAMVGGAVLGAEWSSFRAVSGVVIGFLLPVGVLGSVAFIAGGLKLANSGGWKAAGLAGVVALLVAGAGLGVWIKGAAPDALPVAQAAKEIVEQAPSCDCGSGAAECVGPRGGRYCLRPDGSKKYVGG